MKGLKPVVGVGSLTWAVLVLLLLRNLGQVATRHIPVDSSFGCGEVPLQVGHDWVGVLTQLSGRLVQQTTYEERGVFQLFGKEHFLRILRVIVFFLEVRRGVFVLGLLSEGKVVLLHLQLEGIRGRHCVSVLLELEEKGRFFVVFEKPFGKFVFLESELSLTGLPLLAKKGLRVVEGKLPLQHPLLVHTLHLLVWSFGEDFGVGVCLLRLHLNSNELELFLGVSLADSLFDQGRLVVGGFESVQLVLAGSEAVGIFGKKLIYFFLFEEDWGNLWGETIGLFFEFQLERVAFDIALGLGAIGVALDFLLEEVVFLRNRGYRSLLGVE